MNTTAHDGLLVLDKPTGMTSRDAVNRVQRWFPRKTRIGHTGTLDPLATGVLVVCIGSATRLADYVQKMRKTYTSTFRLGATSDSDDADGTLTPTPDATLPTENAIRSALSEFLGPLDQVPPAYSAAHVSGQRAYTLARKGQAVELQARRVEVYGIEFLEYTEADLDVRVHCGKGTYIRSIARDLGERLECGAYVQTLRRTAVGPFAEDKALSLDTLPEEARAHLLPIGLALGELPRIEVSSEEAARLRHGQRLRIATAFEATVDEVEVGIFDEDATLVGVGVVDRVRRQLRPVKVLR